MVAVLRPNRDSQWHRQGLRVPRPSALPEESWCVVVVPRWAGGGWSTRLGKKRFEGGSKEVLEYYRSVHRSVRVKRVPRGEARFEFRRKGDRCVLRENGVIRRSAMP